MEATSYKFQNNAKRLHGKTTPNIFIFNIIKFHGTECDDWQYTTLYNILEKVQVWETKYCCIEIFDFIHVIH